MRYFDFSPPGLVCFGVLFVVASLVALALYGLARSPNRWVKLLKRLVGIAAGLAAVLLVLATLGSKSRPYPIIFLALTIGLSAIQATLERSSGREAWSWGQQWGRSFVTYLVSGLLGTFVLAYSAMFLVTFFFASSPLYKFTNMTSWGYLAGGALAPLAISFFRWMLSSIQLRPGVDRHLEEGDAEAVPEPTPTP